MHTVRLTTVICLVFVGLVSLAGAFVTASAAQTQLVSVNRDGSGTANGTSAGSAFSADGRFVAFVSTASDLLSGVTSGQNVYVRDLQTGTVELVSISHLGNGGANGQCFNPVISADGRFVAFESTANNLVPVDTNGRYGQGGRLSDVFVRDLELGVTTLVSVNLAGDTGENESFRPAITPDGTTVAFYSRAKDLVSGSAHGCYPFLQESTVDIYVRGLSGGPTRLVTANPSGRGGCGEATGFLPPAISADGRYVAFSSTAWDLVANDTNSWGMVDVFVRDLASETTTLVSVNLNGTTGSNAQNDRSEYAFMSADGRFVAFTSYVPNLVANDTNGIAGPSSGRRRDVFLRDVWAGQTTLVSVNASGNDSGSGGESFAQAMTPDGRYVAFYSEATDLVSATDSNGARDVFVRDLLNGTTTLVSVDRAGATTANADSHLGAISADGRYVAFTSAASDLVDNDSNDTYDAFVRDLQARATSLASVNAAGTASGNAYTFAPSLSPDSRLVAFTSFASDLVALPDTNGQADVFLRPVAATPEQALTELIELIGSYSLPKGLENSLSVKLENARTSLATGDIATACSQISAFINQVEAQRGKKLSDIQADELIAAANSIRGALGCA